MGTLYTELGYGFAASDSEAEARQRAFWASFRRRLKSAPAAVRRFYRPGTSQVTPHDAVIRAANLDRAGRALDLVLGQKTWKPYARIHIRLGGVDLTDGEAAAWRALLRHRKVEWLFEDWERLDAQVTQFRTLWYAGPRGRTKVSPFWETSVRFTNVEIDVTPGRRRSRVARSRARRTAARSR